MSHVYMYAAALSASSCFFQVKKAGFVCEIPWKEGGFHPRGRVVPGKLAGKTKCMRTLPSTRLAEPLEKGQPAKQGSRGGCTCNSRELGKRWMGGQLLGKRWVAGQLLGKRWMGRRPLQQRMGLAGMGVG